MLDELLPYYENELTYLRRLSKEFAAKYPKIASRLQMDGEVCEDPHVERMIESFAFLTSRIHKKLDDEFPRITEAMDRLVPVADRGARIRRVAAVATAMWALLADHERRAENGEAGADNLDEIVAMLAAMLTAPPAHGDSSRESRFDGSHYDRVAGRP